MRFTKCWSKFWMILIMMILFIFQFVKLSGLSKKKHLSRFKSRSLGKSKLETTSNEDCVNSGDIKITRFTYYNRNGVRPVIPYLYSVCISLMDKNVYFTFNKKIKALPNDLCTQTSTKAQNQITSYDRFTCEGVQEISSESKKFKFYIKASISNLLHLNLSSIQDMGVGQESFIVLSNARYTNRAMADDKTKQRPTVIYKLIHTNFSELLKFYMEAYRLYPKLKVFSLPSPK